MEEYDYAADLAIDPYALDEEWLRQPSLYMKYSLLVADAEKKRGLAKERLDVTKAELERAIRKDPDKYIPTEIKLTEAVITSTIVLQPAYREDNSKLTEANYELDILQAAVRAFDHRKSALENEVRLWVGNYFSGPKEPRDIPGGKRIVDLARGKVAERSREALNRSIDKSKEGEEPPRRRRT